jgi:hypothetical protein
VSAVSSDLHACEDELARSRRAVDGLWTSRRVLIDEVKALRHQLRERDSQLKVQAARIAELERAGGATSTTTAWQPSSEVPYLSSPSARAAVVGARLSSELAAAEAELIELLKDRPQSGYTLTSTSPAGRSILRTPTTRR